MMRFSRKSIKLLTTVIRNNSDFIINHNGKRCSVITLRYNFVQSSFYSQGNKSTLQHDDNKTTSPLGSLLKESNDTVQEKIEEEEKKKQRENSWRTMKLTLAFFGVSFTCLGAYIVFTLGAPERDLNGNLIKDDLIEKPIVLQYFIRSYRQLDYYRRLIKEPSREKLLPDPLQYPYLQPKYTLVLELTDVLVHPDWTYSTGWRFKKRPMLDYFLETLHGSYEIVIYTAEQGMTVFPLIDAIDPKNIIAYKLVRDATHFSGGHHVKSLDNLNRDLSKVICVDWNAQNVKFNPENLLNIQKWTGNDDDTSLVDLAAFLKTVADNDVEDVREVLRHYSSYDDPIAAFREKQKQLLEELEAQAAAKRDKAQSRTLWAPSLFNRKPF
ncbi:mitochondrial import inner membrane translocase subunit TIM50-C-like [Diorhabda sublineata]|uniref:mitochondrial import inner membrane translocase subunit TIM50-C-like n=1 Tax=Diorhabda sublineata TaxID=1163346 RepID=UPI0024E0B107|nr:mitochondrial import inner membrane translocase subunit TIM50-C-like [Diorhabda sublineata]